MRNLLRSALPFHNHKTNNHSKQSEVSLVVLATGHTKEEAEQNALRQAVGQVCATVFSVEENTLQDVWLRNGCIARHTEVAYYENADSQPLLTLRVTLSLPALRQSLIEKEADTIWANSVFAMALQLKKLDNTSEQRAMDMLGKYLQAVSDLFDYRLNLNEPKLDGNGFVLIEGTVSVIYTKHCHDFVSFLWKTLESLSLTEEEIANAEDNDTPCYELTFPMGSEDEKKKAFDWHLSQKKSYIDKTYLSPVFHMRNSYDLDIAALMMNTVKYQIYDNLSSPTRAKISAKKVGLLSKIYPFRMSAETDIRDGQERCVLTTCKLPEVGESVEEIEVTIYVPEAEIATYTEFGVKPQDAKIN